MSKTLKWIIGTVLLLGIVAIIYFSVTKEERYFDKIEVPKTTMVYNKTHWTYIDTIIYVGVAKLNLSPKIVIVEELTKNNRPLRDLKELDLDAYIYGVNSQYILSIREMNREQTISAIAHELIHLEQYESGRLRNTPDTLTFEGKHYFRNTTMNYVNRPWEIEAYKRQHWLANSIKEELYNEK